MGNTIAGVRGRRETRKAIERSMDHWSELSEVPSRSNEEMAADDRELFLTLQRDPTWGEFFQTFNYDTEVRPRVGELKVGAKFAEGGQAELFHASVTWKDQKLNVDDLRRETEHALKVFKKGTRLRHLQSQWSQDYLRWWAEARKRQGRGEDLGKRHECEVRCGTLLQNGQFAFVMVKEEEDLRTLIDRRIKFKPFSNRETIKPESALHCGPFSKSDTAKCMYGIALGMELLHSQNIVHRDLKASNVLMAKYKGVDGYYVADFECSVGVVGTGFFRAPEILQALKDGNLSQKPEVFSKAADVYSYGMTCYEVLTGKLPFEERPRTDYDFVLNGQRPEVPEYVDGWARKLLKRCWQSDPAQRPSFSQIVKLLKDHIS